MHRYYISSDSNLNIHVIFRKAALLLTKGEDEGDESGSSDNEVDNGNTSTVIINLKYLEIHLNNIFPWS